MPKHILQRLYNCDSAVVIYDRRSRLTTDFKLLNDEQLVFVNHYPVMFSLNSQNHWKKFTEICEKTLNKAVIMQPPRGLSREQKNLTALVPDGATYASKQANIDAILFPISFSDRRKWRNAFFIFLFLCLMQRPDGRTAQLWRQIFVRIEKVRKWGPFAASFIKSTFLLMLQHYKVKF